MNKRLTFSLLVRCTRLLLLWLLLLVVLVTVADLAAVIIIVVVACVVTRTFGLVTDVRYLELFHNVITLLILGALLGGRYHLLDDLLLLLLGDLGSFLA